ncbi:right-handed parallel beta-helix repeat-containing protein [Streptomyces sp. CRN 30]|uniref:right-handed parallel beta-helix repeat-containing protein n=1 Tax=Streptomyces sp. CRN 30 TaxID=3075613 RepID=UPI002A7F95C0|nr:right-handed parallel beta-helix repeat-containing protein [Streptomyces sp. CRN 30]
MTVLARIPRVRTGRGGTTALCAAALLAGTTVAFSPPVQAAACTGQIRYASSTNTLYLTSGTNTPSEILRLCPSAPLVKSAGTAGVWQLNASIVVQNGAILRLHGTGAGGDVNTLRLRSAADGDPLRVSSITAQYGTIDIDRVTVTSWDEQKNGPDTDPDVPSGGTRGRAFIRALSYVDAGGVARESRMDIKDSDLGYLGYNGAEAYGVSYKARGCGIETPDVCDRLEVRGSQTGSRFHHNYMGTYTWGAYGMTFDGNEYDNNVSYGLDPHDDSDHLTITDNHSHHNGNHGIICSQRCDNLEIVGNEVHHNGIPPYVPPGDDDPSDNQVHGIMLHRGVTDTVVRDNRVYDHPNGAGIAVFDSSDNTVTGNRIERARYGLRYSVGSRDITTTGNTVTDSGQYAVFTYKGSDAPSYTGTTGRPGDLTFTGNTFAGAAGDAVRLNEGDDLTFRNNTFTGTFGTGPLTQRTTGTVIDGDRRPASFTYRVRGDADTSGSITFRNLSGAVSVQLDTYSSAAFSTGGLTPGATYRLTAGSRTVTTGRADASGVVTLRAQGSGGSAAEYRISPA